MVTYATTIGQIPRLTGAFLFFLASSTQIFNSHEPLLEKATKGCASSQLKRKARGQKWNPWNKDSVSKWREPQGDGFVSGPQRSRGTRGCRRGHLLEAGESLTEYLIQDVGGGSISRCVTDWLKHWERVGRC